ncbi:MAG: SDR family NAD(P)-dependent oxidoreductase, partial [bacterium]
MSSLNDKVAIVTGSARGIGKAIALRLAQDGANVVVTDISLESLKITANDIEKLGRKSLY